MPHAFLLKDVLQKMQRIDANITEDSITSSGAR
jgi:hypothetical protein